MHRLKVDAQVGHAVGDLATDPACGEAQMDLAVVSQRVDVAVPTATYVTRVALCETGQTQVSARYP